jgi:hypothetical protein
MRVFKLIDKKFEKIWDSNRGSFEFDLGKECKFTIDINELFRGE